jgi:hypothetical protein
VWGVLRAMEEDGGTEKPKPVVDHYYVKEKKDSHKLFIKRTASEWESLFHSFCLHILDRGDASR